MNVFAVPEDVSLAEVVDRVRAASRVALDTEFHHERSYSAKLMVVQLAIGDDVFIVDPLELADLRPLADALAETEIVGHALSSDVRIFVDRFERLPGRIVDTQIQAAFLGYGMQVSLAELVADVARVRLRKSQTVSDWSRRPLSAAQQEYLVDDVRYLFPVADELARRLDASGRRAWFEEEARALVDPARYAVDAERVYLRLPGASRMSRRELGILREIALMREAIARDRDVPPKYVLPDDVVTSLASLRPLSVDDLAPLRRLDAGARKHLGERIVAATARALALADDELPQRPPRPPGGDRESVASLLSVFASAVAAEHDIPAGMLVSRSTLERIARERPASVDALVATLGGSRWRAELLAAPLFDVLRGATALAISVAPDGRAHVRALPLDGRDGSNAGAGEVPAHERASG